MSLFIQLHQHFPFAVMYMDFRTDRLITKFYVDSSMLHWTGSFYTRALAALFINENMMSTRV